MGDIIKYQNGSLLAEERIRDDEKPEEDFDDDARADDDTPTSTSLGGRRDEWGSHAEFVLSLIGYAVGLGNFWRFPYLCMRNGGGAFLIPYFTFLVLCGIPVYFLELAVGQYSSQSPLGLWRFIPVASGLGWAMMLVSGVVCIYYNVIMAWALYFMFASFTTGPLPWSTCNNEWNRPGCVQRGGGLLELSVNASDSNGGNIYNATFGKYDNDYDNFTSPANGTGAETMMTSAEQYWQYEVLQLSAGIHELAGVRWPLVGCLALAWVFVFGSLFRGVKSLGKVVYVTATLPYGMLLVLLVRGATLPGAAAGVLYYLTPDFRRLASFQVWVEACAQIFYSLGPGYGGLITLASYNSFHNNCLRDALIVTIANCMTSVFAGFVVFSVLGYMAHTIGVTIDEVVTSGPGLAFVVYPEALATLPYPQVWSAIFFAMLVIIGLDTQFGMFETTSSGFVDQFPRLLLKRKTLFTGALCVVALLLGVPLVTRGGMYIFQIFDWYSASFSLMTISTLECLCLGWAYGGRRLLADISTMVGRRVSFVWQLCWMVVTPLIFVGVLLCTIVAFKPPSYGPYEYPWGAEMLGWVLGTCSLVPIPVCAGLAFAKATGSPRARFKSVCTPNEAWGSEHDSTNCKRCSHGNC